VEQAIAPHRPASATEAKASFFIQRSWENSCGADLCIAATGVSIQIRRNQLVYVIVGALLQRCWIIKTNRAC
jgi:hypothetical protein